MADLDIDQISVSVAGQAILDAVSLRPQAGQLTSIIGPNGAGKSTLLRAIVGLATLHSGKICIDGQPVNRLSVADRARRIAYLPQQIPISWPISVYDAVAMGRYAHGGRASALGAQCGAVVDAMLGHCAITHLKERRMTTLSGGELSRVHLARTMATQAPVLLVDEPVAALDPAHQLAAMHLLRTHAESGGTVIAVLHDLPLAGRFSDRIIGMKAGRICFDEPVNTALSAPRLSALYDVPMQVDKSRGWPEPRLI